MIAVAETMKLAATSDRNCTSGRKGRYDGAATEQSRDSLRGIKQRIRGRQLRAIRNQPGHRRLQCGAEERLPNREHQNDQDNTPLGRTPQHQPHEHTVDTAGYSVFR
jgi:hypothetical protein